MIFYIKHLKKFELPDKKNIGKLFSKYDLLFLDQDNFSSDLSQILILQYPFSRASMFSLPFLPNFTLACWNPFFISFSILSYPMPPRATLIGYTKPNAKPSQSDLLSSYIQTNTFSVKHDTYQKSQSLRPVSLSKLDNTVNNNSIFNIKCAGFSTKW